MSPLAWTALFAVLGSGIAGACLVFGMSRELRWRLIADLPTSKTTGVFIGLVELKGTAELDAPLQCHLCDRTCVWHRWTIAEHWSKTETETYRDAQGRSRTRTKHSSGWTTVDSGGDALPFHLRDDYGAVQVIPDGADVDGVEVLGVDCDSSHPLYYGKGPPGAIMHSDHRRRFTESAIPIDQPLFVNG
ncbi:MAG: hypothetical protein H0W72_11815 [Planctomycetes bacterium]|nr:hypothetical protein [Planctomycetota bacterium]